MHYKNVLVTGGAGFVGSSIAIKLKEKYPEITVSALDNLKRRGSELNIPRLKAAGVIFVHGDIRNKEDLIPFSQLDLIIECSAEPSVLAGVNSAPDYLINTNLLGTLNCLELARRTGATFLFLSTSRVYPYKLINAANYIETETRFELSPDQTIKGISEKGISEELSLIGPRSLYGSTKLASELFITEYADTYGIKTLINRFGCIAGPWQMGKVDQGVMVLWISRHMFNKKLTYNGYGGKGKQVRDFLHVDDLFEVLDLQLNNFEKVQNLTLNVGGGKDVSVSLLELTALCEEFIGNKIQIDPVLEDRALDIRSYISDNTAIEKLLSWKPKKSVRDIVSETTKWIKENQASLSQILE